MHLCQRFSIVETLVKCDFRNCLQSLLWFGLHLFKRLRTLSSKWLEENPSINWILEFLLSVVREVRSHRGTYRSFVKNDRNLDGWTRIWTRSQPGFGSTLGVDLDLNLDKCFESSWEVWKPFSCVINVLCYILYHATEPRTSSK